MKVATRVTVAHDLTRHWPISRCFHYQIGMIRGECEAALRLRRLSIANVRCWSSCELALTDLDDSPLDQAVRQELV